MFVGHWSPSANDCRVFLQAVPRSGGYNRRLRFYKHHWSTRIGSSLPRICWVALKTMGMSIPNIGFLVGRDPSHYSIALSKTLVLGVIGLNVLRDVNAALKSSDDWYQQELKGSNNGTAGYMCLLYFFFVYEEVTARILNNSTTNYKVWSAGRKPTWLPARSVLTVRCTTHKSKDPYIAIVEEQDACILPHGLVLVPALKEVPTSGWVPVQLAIYSNSDLYLAPRTPICLLEPSSTHIHSPTSDASDVLVEEVRIVLHRLTSSKNWWIGWRKVRKWKDTRKKYDNCKTWSALIMMDSAKMTLSSDIATKLKTRFY